MIPELHLISATSYDFKSLKATLDRVLKLRTDESYPVNFSEDAQVLLNIALFFGWNMKNPLNILRHVPDLFMQYVSYTFMIACDIKTWDELQTVKLSIVSRELVDCHLFIVTGTLAHWFQTITLNIGRDWGYSFEAKFLIDKIVLILERERGLKQLFENYNKKFQKDQTFLLEEL